METRHAIVGSAVGAVAVAWMNGRLWRAHEKASPVCLSDLAHANSRTQYVYFGGSFTKASSHASVLLSRLALDGSVLSADSSLKRLNVAAEYGSVYSRLRLRRTAYNKLVVIGGSLGAINAFRLAREFCRDVETSLLVIDPVLSANGMKREARLAAYATAHVRPGPITNRLLAPLMPVLIPGRSADIYDEVEGVEQSALDSLKQMRSVSMAYFLDVARAICSAEMPDPGSYQGMKVVGLFSENEPTLDEAGKRADFGFATQRADVQSHVVLGAHHLTLVEQPLVWLSALNRALCQL